MRIAIGHLDSPGRARGAVGRLDAWCYVLSVTNRSALPRSSKSVLLALRMTQLLPSAPRCTNERATTRVVAHHEP